MVCVPLLPTYATVALIVDVTCRCTVAFQASTLGSLLLKGRTKALRPSGKSGRPLTPTHCALSGVNTPPTTPLGSVIALQLLVARVPPSAVAGFAVTGPFARKKAVLKSCPLVVFVCWLARTGTFCVTAWPKIDPKTPLSKLRPVASPAKLFRVPLDTHPKQWPDGV